MSETTNRYATPFDGEIPAEKAARFLARQFVGSALAVVLNALCDEISRLREAGRQVADVALVVHEATR